MKKVYPRKREEDTCYNRSVKALQKKTQRKTTPSTLAGGLERLERQIAHLGLASRREAKSLITSGQVRVNGKIVREPGFGIAPQKDVITLPEDTDQKETVLLYKPRGIETTKTVPSATDIHSRYPALSHLSPIGRLDKESEGLILLTNDGSLTRALTKEGSTVEKEYLVRVREHVTNADLEKMATGILIDKIRTKPAKTKRVSRTSFTIILQEGRKHQIRRMCAACHLTIEVLKRIRIGHLTIGNMNAGNIKKISSKDSQLLKKDNASLSEKEIF